MGLWQWITGSGSGHAKASSASATALPHIGNLTGDYGVRVQHGKDIVYPRHNFLTPTDERKMLDAQAMEAVVDFGILARDSLEFARAVHTKPIADYGKANFVKADGSSVSVPLTRIVQAHILAMREYMEKDRSASNMPPALKRNFANEPLRASQDQAFFNAVTYAARTGQRWDTSNDPENVEYFIERYRYARGKFAKKLETAQQAAYEQLVSKNTRDYHYNMLILGDVFQFGLVSPSAMASIYRGALVYGQYTGDYSMAKICEWGFAHNEMFRQSNAELGMAAGNLEKEREQILSDLAAGKIPITGAAAISPAPAPSATMPPLPLPLPLPSLPTPAAPMAAARYTPLIDFGSKDNKDIVTALEGVRKAVEEQGQEKPLTKTQALQIENIFRHNPLLIPGLIKGTTTLDDLRRLLRNPVQRRALAETFGDALEASIGKFAGNFR